MLACGERGPRLSGPLPRATRWWRLPSQALLRETGVQSSTTRCPSRCLLVHRLLATLWAFPPGTAAHYFTARIPFAEEQRSRKSPSGGGDRGGLGAAALITFSSSLCCFRRALEIALFCLCRSCSASHSSFVQDSASMPSEPTFWLRTFAGHL